MDITLIISIIIIVFLIIIVINNTKKYQILNESHDKYYNLHNIYTKENNDLINKITKLENKYKNILDIDLELDKRNKELLNINSKISETMYQLETIKNSYDLKKNNLDKDFSIKFNDLNDQYQIKKDIFNDLLKEISTLEESLENITYGFYKPHYDFNSSDEYKNSLESIRNKQLSLIKSEKATFCSVPWQVGGSEKEGQKMTKKYSKLMLRAFNGECDAAISKVKWNNIVNMETRIQKSFEAINKLGSSHQIRIIDEYKTLKLSELRLEFELEEKLYREKEEQRRIKEQMREEELALKEIEKIKKQSEDDELRYQKALEKARFELESANGKHLENLNNKINELELNLKLAQEQKQRAISQAQLTKSGHVYIISNIGSFGENIYKIGMTRRLEPIDRVKELSGASVPFNFDIHGVIYSENAPELENLLHRKLEKNKVNLVNSRREFFNVSIDEIENILNQMNIKFEFTKLAEAKEYRESQSIRSVSSNKYSELKDNSIKQYPSYLN